MNRGALIRWRQGLLALGLGVMTVLAIQYDRPNYLLPESARRFVQYYHLLGEAEWRVPYWERVVLSLVLARCQDQGAGRTSEAIAPQTSITSSS
jgi:hypothetical protein